MTANTANSAATSFGRQMKKMRESHGWTLRQMHELTKVDYTTLSRVEHGQRPPTERWLMRATAFSLSCADGS
jgi:transcriptional regulator with XRE-family HTH domain